MNKNPNPKIRAGRNRTITISNHERKVYKKELLQLENNTKIKSIENKIINQDILEITNFLPKRFADLMILDPPYNLTKKFRSISFRKKKIGEYADWFEKLLIPLLPLLKKTASVYICSEWQSSTPVHLVLEKYLKVRNRITWEREKGRGAKINFKNSSEDIWFATVSDKYTFNLDDVKLKRRVLAPYTDTDGKAKDWHQGRDGRFRLTSPSNIWSDITVPFWSMPENTDHPTQKPEKLLAKLILASTNKNEIVFDPFMGTGATIVTASKLKRRFLGVEIEPEYCITAAKRLHLAKTNRTIQGYSNGEFWERNTSAYIKKHH